MLFLAANTHEVEMLVNSCGVLPIKFLRRAMVKLAYEVEVKILMGEAPRPPRGKILLDFLDYFFESSSFEVLMSKAARSIFEKSLCGMDSSHSTDAGMTDSTSFVTTTTFSKRCPPS